MASQEHTTRDEVVASVRLRREQHTQLRAVAELEHRTLSQELRRLIEQRLAGVEDREAA